ncbi:protein of unknown function [Pararobbsia alpina]|uniref:hypothetical protein n=1 Tax=Pararobbsia alpina TaxID=621374 RepID=UPI0039A7831F
MARFIGNRDKVVELRTFHKKPTSKAGRTFEDLVQLNTDELIGGGDTREARKTFRINEALIKAQGNVPVEYAAAIAAAAVAASKAASKSQRRGKHTGAAGTQAEAQNSIPPEAAQLSAGSNAEESDDDILERAVELLKARGYSEQLEAHVGRTGSVGTAREEEKKEPQPMNAPSREEFEARLETIEVKMDARTKSIEDKIDGLVARLTERDQRLEMLAQQATKSAESAAQSAEKAAGLRASYWASAVVTIVSVLAIAAGMFIGMKQSDESLVQATLSVFQAGQAAGASAPAPSLPSAIKPQTLPSLGK